MIRVDEATKKEAVRNCPAKDKHNRHVMAGCVCPGCGVGRDEWLRSPEDRARLSADADNDKTLRTESFAKKSWETWAKEMGIGAGDEYDRLLNIYLDRLLELGCLAKDENHINWVNSAVNTDWRHVSYEKMKVVAEAMGWKLVVRKYEVKRVIGGYQIYLNDEPLRGRYFSDKTIAETCMNRLKEEECD